MIKTGLRLFAISALLVAGYLPGAFAESIRLRATLNGTSETPPTASGGSGAGEFIFETSTNQLTYTIVYRGLSGPATAAHMHRTAHSGNEGALITFMVPTSPISGTATLNAADASALLEGGLYVDIHTQAYGGGEVRGQITR